MTLGRLYADFVDGLADWQVQLLRRTADEMADALDRDAMRDVEGAREWRDLSACRESPEG